MLITSYQQRYFVLNKINAGCLMQLLQKVTSPINNLEFGVLTLQIHSHIKNSIL